MFLRALRGLRLWGWWGGRWEGGVWGGEVVEGHGILRGGGWGGALELMLGGVVVHLAGALSPSLRTNPLENFDLSVLVVG